MAAFPSRHSSAGMAPCSSLISAMMSSFFTAPECRSVSDPYLIDSGNSEIRSWGSHSIRIENA